jgi:hypothetical protein
MAILYVGCIDLAKTVFAVHGVNDAGKPELVRPMVARAKLAELIASLPCVIGMEACSGAHYLTVHCRCQAQPESQQPRRQATTTRPSMPSSKN